ncbi:MAG: hypothetical protein A2268_00355 [Candidatus Raymondbacteria bacterium RifOxyA12_full_50_37]|uniref:ATPase n=1 Tax=Candidatus Raymondbacteria bacterium RIFOXYD12_FULL_49_13 TaxID=1817890 RepID=A0A1F7F2V3_UNCRA|nr:MAG: hypothetical protein A2268_00355 [Candidatus Raymondbacteria bacterium RifOxyA12_full_50_37]OGJ92768.1 MAG: hypothetical protein A2248_04405 [Candidatus Raymondbacteria bacterium RIFOXYA2_FULL_49_16]OGK00291.1 MAG: hypothetical protein A2350_16650 [Candidatus Raymondbacteria bacterium RifOxyB12_full_50_8]OGK00971.1 MAG: hypothetical protein A2519_17065 [Candidatus Raymondbacteria bacterium RIFOXYD12_FULL_49_13]OGK02464.1 MAG: hypothetical protein A2487_20820 [Candidatus Raymondbacteria 
MQYHASPALFGEQIAALPERSTIVVDEIQKVPTLLDYVQRGIDRQGHIFILSGSSARKLKRGSANMLGGRALDLRLHPLTSAEIGATFNLEHAIRFGTIPKICSLLNEENQDLAMAHLRSYITTYIKEEIQQEALTRNIGAFQRFLAVAAQNNGRLVEFSNIARESAVAASTVKEYFHILEDTLIGFLLPPWSKKERLKTHSKFYFFDCGVACAIQNRLADPPTPEDRGFLFETWFIGELRRIRDYSGKQHEFSFWRKNNHEVDLIVSTGRGPVLGIECKSGSAEISVSTVKAFREKFRDVPLVVASAFGTIPRIVHGVEVLPWAEVIRRYRQI